MSRTCYWPGRIGAYRVRSLPMSSGGGCVSGRSVAGLTLRTSPPAIPSRFVRRPRVEALLRRAVTGAVTLVSAGPGYGKTLSLAHWVRHGGPPGRIAWLSIDGSDDSLPGFWSGLLRAVELSGAIPAGSGLLELRPAASFGLAEAAGVIDELVTLPEPLVVVLDDLQQLRDRDLLRSIDLLLERRPPDLHLVLSARYDPPLRLQRLAVAGGLTEIRSRELAFTPAEARELLAGSDLLLPEGVVEALVDRTRGWAAGLRLAAMGLDRHTSEADVARLRGSDRPVAEYLLDEVLDQLPADDRRFLLFSSVADPVCAGLAQALTGDEDAQSRLERLEARNSFLVGLAGGRTWFGWHPLFRELLAHELTLQAPGMAAHLHHLAAGWLEDRGDYVAAIGQLTAAQDWTAIGRLITERAAPDLVAAQGGALVDALEPAALRSRVEPIPATLLASALRNFRRFDYDAMLRDANSAALAAGHSDDVGAGPATSAPPSGIDVLVAVLRMAHARARDPRSLVAAASEAIELVDRMPRHRLPAVERYRAITTANLGTGLLWNGDLPAAAATLAQAQESCREWELSLPELTTMGHLAIIEAVYGRFPQAVRDGERARTEADRHGWSPEPQASGHMVALAWAALAAGRLDAADRLIAAAIGRGNPDTGCQSALAVLSIEVALTRRDHALAAKRVDDLNTVIVRGKGLPPMLAACARLAAADAQLVRGRPDGARRLLPDMQNIPFSDALRTVVLAKCLLAEDDATGCLDLLTRRLPELDPFAAPAVDGRLVAALAAARLRQDARSLTLISEAIDIAVAPGIVRPFQLAGARARPLLNRHRGLVGHHATFTTALLQATEPTGTPAPTPTTGPTQALTERELSVLVFLPTYMKSNDIAEELFLSVNTVKSHLQAIYRKLGVSSRQEAVLRARELGML